MKSDQPAGPLRVLILEDEPADAELIVRELRKAGIAFIHERVEGKRQFIVALKTFHTDIILSDFKMPQFDGLAALKIARRQAPDTPFLFVSGSIGEEKAIETLALGASDYIFKDNLARLGPAVKRVLAAAEWKRQKLEAEKSLGESERMFSTLVANLPGFVYRCRNDHDWTMEYISPGCREVTGYAPDDFLLNRKLAFNSIIHPDHRDTIRQEWQERLRQRMPFEFEYRITTAAGELRWVWERGQGIFGPDGALLFLEGFVTDITPRRQMEDRLRESEEKYRTLVETSPDAIVIVDAGGRVTFASRKTLDLFGVSPQTSVIGSSILDFVEPADIPRVQERMVEILAGRSLPQVREYRLHWQDRRWFWGEVSSAPLPDFVGRNVGLLLILRDVSERKLAEEQIRSSLKEKEVLLQEIHHRVKNNLQIISGLLTLQADQAAGKSLDDIFRESQDRIRTIALIHEKLYRSHNLAEIAFDEYLRALIDNLITSYAIGGGRIATRYEMEPIYLTIEKAIPLGLIVNELVTNSLKHAFPAGRRGEIRIGLHGYQGAKSFAQKTDSGTIQVVPTIELIVADDGIGLPAGRSPLGQKTLGMNLVTMLAQQLRAELKVNMGDGTEFLLRFPGLPGGDGTHVNKHGK